MSHVSATGSPVSKVHLSIFKGTTRGLSGVFLPLVMNPLRPLKYGLMVCHGQYNILLWEDLFRWLRYAAGPLDVPLEVNGSVWRLFHRMINLSNYKNMKTMFNSGPLRTGILVSKKEYNV